MILLVVGMVMRVWQRVEGVAVWRVRTRVVGGDFLGVGLPEGWLHNEVGVLFGGVFFS